MITFTEKAVAKVKEFMEGSGESGMALRIIVEETPKPSFRYDFQLEEWKSEKATDVIVREGGFATRMDPASARLLKGATVDWAEKDSSAGFVVDNPNRPNEGQGSNMNDRIIEMIKTVHDPEIPVNIYELGLIYNIEVKDEGLVKIIMTLTAPNCPEAEVIPVNVENAVKKLEGVEKVDVEVTFEPVWTPDKMSEAAKLQLGVS